jgi:hypothetical protein
VLAHGREPVGRVVLGVLFEALESAERQHAVLYLELVQAVLPAVMRRYLEDLVSTQTEETRGPLQQWFEARGEARGEAKAVLTVLEARGVEVPDEARDRITGCTDAAQLDAWVRRAATADTLDDLFD